jgi:hypothetical protein
MRHAGPFLGTGLGCPDIHALVELLRVGVDDLAGEAKGEEEGCGGLPGGGRASDGEELLHGVAG